MNQQQAEEFIRIWQTSDSVIEAAEKLGISANAARSQASRLRRKGIPLILGPGGRDRIEDYGKLRELAEKLSENS